MLLLFVELKMPMTFDCNIFNMERDEMGMRLTHSPDLPPTDD